MISQKCEGKPGQRPYSQHTEPEVGSDSRRLMQRTEMIWVLKVLNTIILLSLDPHLLPPPATAHNFSICGWMT